MPIKESSTGSKLDVNENSSCRLIFSVVDYDGSAITTINSVTFTLTDRITGDIINSRDAVDISSDFDVNGNCDLLLSSADNPVVHNANSILGDTDEEIHLATFNISALSGGDTLWLTETIWLNIINIEQT